MGTKFKVTSVALLVIFTLILGSAGYVRAQVTTLKALTAWPKNATDNKSLDFFIESVE
jgi:hypothetical protein